VLGDPVDQVCKPWLEASAEVAFVVVDVDATGDGEERPGWDGVQLGQQRADVAHQFWAVRTVNGTTDQGFTGHPAHHQVLHRPFGRVGARMSQ